MYWLWVTNALKMASKLVFERVVWFELIPPLSNKWELTPSLGEKT